jgi:hypothetical protein
VFRRGPSKLFRLFFWDRAGDTFKPGPWFKGRLFPDRSDLSPDGRHLIYFAMAGVAWAVPRTGGTWTAISQLPSLKAVALWRQGDTWSGGGMFTSSRSYWLNADDCTELIRDNSGLRRDPRQPIGLYQARLERDGWVARKTDDGPVLEKSTREGWILRRLRKRGYKLHQPEGSTLTFADWEWAEWDRNRLLWAEAGCIRTAGIGTHKLGRARTLHDFNETLPTLSSK